MDRLLEVTHRAESRHFWFRGFRGFVRPLLASATAGRPHARVLDAGCGTGANLTMLDEFGDTWGLDLNRTGLRFAVHAGHRRVTRATVAAIPFADAAFDLVTSFDVLYALDDAAEHAAVGEMFRVLRPGGYLVVNVPAMRILHGHHSILAGELRRYTRRSVCELIEGAGFEIQRVTYTNAILFPLMLAVRLAQRLVGLSDPARAEMDIEVPPAPINGLLTLAVKAEARLVRHVSMPFGSSLLCLARKREAGRERPGAAGGGDQEAGVTRTS